MAEQAHPPSHSALTRDSNRSQSKVGGGAREQSVGCGSKRSATSGVGKRAGQASGKKARREVSGARDCVAHCTRSRTRPRPSSASASAREDEARCSYPLRNRAHRDASVSSSTSNESTEETPASQPTNTETTLQLPYLRQTSARRSIAAASGHKGAATHKQKSQVLSEERRRGGRARARDMPQPPHNSTRVESKGKSSLGSCASSGAAPARAVSLTTGGVASTSSQSAGAASVAAAPDMQPHKAKSKPSSSSSTEECGAGGGGAAGGAGGGAEESSSEEGEVGRLQALLEARGLPPQLLGALGPRMQHLLHRSVGANTQALAKATQLLQGLQATGDEGQQLQAVIEMCQLLVMGNEDTLAGFPVRQVVPALVNLLAMDHNFDMMNHACRALTYMMEALPRSSGAVALAVPAFLDKLHAITCMDVAEQSLTALDMLSRRHSKAILHARGVAACLTYLDFFSINAQRAALSITANCCQNLTTDEFHYVRDSLQLLANRLTQQDKKCVECVCVAFSRLVDSYRHEPARLQEIATPDLLANLQQLLVVSPPLISGATFIMVVRLLWVMCAACPPLALALHHHNIADTLLYLLTGSSVPTDNNEVELVARPPQELYELTCLIGELMPRLPTDGIFAVDAFLDRPWSSAHHDRVVQWQWRDDRGSWRAYSWAECRSLEAGLAAGEEEVCVSVLGRSYTVDLSAMQQVNDSTGTARPVQRLAPPTPAPPSPHASNSNNTDPRVGMVGGGAGAVLVRSLLAVLHEVYWSSAGPGVRAHALKAILRCVHHAPAHLLRQVLRVQVISSHIAGMMASNDLRIVVGSLQLAEILMQRLPHEFGPQFRREGVLHQVSQLADPTVPLPGSPPAHPARTIHSGAGSSGSGGAATAAACGGGGVDPPPLSTQGSSSPASSTTADSWSAASSSHATLQRSSSPLQLAEMLKRKRAVKRSSATPARHARRQREDNAQVATLQGSSSSGWRSGGRAGGKTSSFLSSLNPSRWGRCPHSGKDSHALAQASPLNTLNKEKVRLWVASTAERLARGWGGVEGAGGTLERLAALAAALPGPAVQHQHTALTQLRDTLLTHDLSPFEVNHSGVIGALLQYLTSTECEATGGESRADRLRLFLHVFADLPLDTQSSQCREEEWSVGEGGVGSVAGLRALVGKVNACVSQLEQLPVRVHDLPARPAVSPLKFFNTHQLMCDLKRHPSCTNLKQWKGGVVRIDPLALVQAIERYLAQRGYATPRARDTPASHSDDDANSDDDTEDALAAPHQPAIADSEHKLEFLMGETVLPYNMTVYQAVRQHGDTPEHDPDTDAPLGNAGIWVHTHTIYYRSVEKADTSRAHAAAAQVRKGKGQLGKAGSRRKPDLLWTEGTVPTRECVLWSLLSSRLPGGTAGGEAEDAALPALALLRALHALSRHWSALYNASCLQRLSPLLPTADFVNAKLAAKASRQLQDPLVIMTGNLPPWLRRIAYACPFVFPFECRHLLFYVVSFDRDRALQRLLEAGGERAGAGAGASDSSERVAPRLDRRKRTVQRHAVLRQAEHAMHELAHSKALLEIQYENEVGTGLGPTLEFYALVSQQLQRADLDLWHGSENFKQKPASFGGEIVKNSDAATHLHALSLTDTNTAQPPQTSDVDKEMSEGAEVAYVSWACGLFPQALGRHVRPSHLSRVKAKFRFLGKFMAKAVMDSRMVDIPLSTTFYRWLVGEERYLTLSDVRCVAPELWRSLCRLQQVAERARRIQDDARLTPHQRSHMVEALELDGCPIEELGLDFVLPGDADTELRRGGRDTPVTAHNLHQYVQLVTHWLLYEGVTRQMEAFREGFESVFPLANLRMFYPEELELIFCGSSSDGREQRWEARVLSECIRPDHGYTSESRAVRLLVDILASYGRDEQRRFLQFVTGSPRLPVGGLKALNPPLTVVCKSVEAPRSADEYLPSVMTCVNYLKLPDYSDADTMRAKLRLAADEGQHSFHLS